MENTYNPKAAALLMIANTVEDYDDLAQVQAETGLPLEMLEIMYYSIL